MAPADPIVRFLGVEKTFDGRSLVVRNLDLDIVRGEFLTLLGPSGSGKTTTLMMLAGFETPTAGEIMVEDRAITRVPPHRRDIGVVFQSYALFPHLSVADNVAFPLSVRGVAREETRRRVADALAMVRLPGFGDRQPAHLSGGQQQRVALARALVFAPRIVLMDEPLGALDKQLREEMQLEIKHLHERLGLTVVYVTHDQGEALTMSDRVAVFRDGAIAQLDTPERLYEAPGSAFVARFVGESNMLAGTVEHRDGTSCRVRLADGTTLAAQAGPAPVVGRPALVVFRPERARLANGEDVANRLDGRLVEAIYHGDHVRLRVAAGAETVTVKLAAGQVPPGLAAGMVLSIAVRPEDCRALEPID
ncbi:MAG: ABC transporter ATP-binding protein [Alphaproteobacteria bacterium]